MTWAVLLEDNYTRGVIELLTEAAKPSGSERVVAVVGGALLEEAVDRTLRERLIDDPGVIKNLLKADRPLGNIAPQIDLLYLLGAFDDRTRGALKGLAHVRNFFAHSTSASFDSLDKDSTDAVKRLVLHEGKTHYPHHLFGPDSGVSIESVTSRRDQFVVNLKIGLITLMRDRISHHDHSNRPRSEEEMLALFPDRYAPGGTPK
jgi:DNA-binding MltR family transcriptional regulator